MARALTPQRQRPEILTLALESRRSKKTPVLPRLFQVTLGSLADALGGVCRRFG